MGKPILILALALFLGGGLFVIIAHTKTPTNQPSASTTPSQLAIDLAGITSPQFVGEKPLTPKLQKIQDDANVSIRNWNGGYSDELPLQAVGKRYVLMHHPSETGFISGIVVDAKSGSIIEIGGGYPIETKSGMIYVNDNIKYYKFDTPASVVLANSELPKMQTYNSGGDMPVMTPTETHTDTSLTISVFDMNTVAENPDTPNYKFKKLRDVTFTLP